MIGRCMTILPLMALKGSTLPRSQQLDGDVNQISGWGTPLLESEPNRMLPDRLI